MNTHPRLGGSLKSKQETVGAGEAARFLGIAYPRLMRMVYRGEIDAKLVDGRWRISRGSLEKALTSSGARSHQSAEDRRG